MRLLLSASLSLALCGTAVASGTFIPIETADVQVTQVSANGEYAVGTIIDTAAFRWTASSGAQEVIYDMNGALGINDSGTLAGTIPENGGAINGGRDLGAYAEVGSPPALLTQPLTTNANGYGIANDGTVVGLSFEDDFAGNSVAFVWTAADGMSALPVPRPANYSRANAISPDGSVIVGWNDQDFGERTPIVWIDRMPFDIVDADGFSPGEATGVSANGEFVVGNEYLDIDFNEGAWRWSAETGVELIPGMTFAFGISADGKTIVGNTGFFDTPPRAPMVWREGVGTVPLTDYLAEQGVGIPADWDLSGGGLGGISADGHVLAGWAFGPLGMQSYIIKLDRQDAIFQDGFELAPTH